MREDGLVPEKVQRMIDDIALLRCHILDDVGGVEDDPDRAAGKIGKKLRGLVRIPDDIRRFRLDAEQQTCRAAIR